MTRCHALLCDDPTGGPEPTADLDGMPAHPGCVEYSENEHNTAEVLLRAIFGRQEG